MKQYYVCVLCVCLCITVCVARCQLLGKISLARGAKFNLVRPCEVFCRCCSNHLSRLGELFLRVLTTHRQADTVGGEGEVEIIMLRSTYRCWDWISHSAAQSEIKPNGESYAQ